MKLPVSMFIIMSLLSFAAKGESLYSAEIYPFLGTSIDGFNIQKRQQVRNDMKSIKDTREFSPRLDLSLEKFRSTLRDLISVKFTQNVEIGFDSFKIKPLEDRKCQILQEDTFQISSAHAVKTHRGYGLELRIKLP
jgi:hypothetical protein